MSWSISFPCLVALHFEILQACCKGELRLSYKLESYSGDGEPDLRLSSTNADSTARNSDRFDKALGDEARLAEVTGSKAHHVSPALY